MNNEIYFNEEEESHGWTTRLSGGFCFVTICGLLCHDSSSKQSEQCWFQRPFSNIDSHIFSFYPHTTLLWTYLPPELKTCDNIDTFTTELKKVNLALLKKTCSHKTRWSITSLWYLQPNAHLISLDFIYICIHYIFYLSTTLAQGDIFTFLYSFIIHILPFNIYILKKSSFNLFNPLR